MKDYVLNGIGNFVEHTISQMKYSLEKEVDGFL